MVYPLLGAPCPAGLTEGPQSAASPKHAAVLIPLSGPRSILEAQPLTCPCVFQLLGLQEDVCTVKVSPRRGTLGPNEERQLSLELTAHTLAQSPLDPGLAASSAGINTVLLLISCPGWCVKEETGHREGRAGPPGGFGWS